MRSCPNGFAGLGDTEAVSAYLIHHIGPAQGGVVLSSGIIDLAIGLAFIFGVTAALASVATELISRFLGLRGAYLLGGLRELLDSEQVETDLTRAEKDYDAWKNIVTGTSTQGPGKVVHTACSSVSVRCGSRAWWRLAAAMLSWPSKRRRLMARLRSVTMTRGAFPVLTRDLSS
jgi:hypothetical protein